MYTPEKEASNGISEINHILDSSHIELILPMSQQVNYWLQTFNFYPPHTDFITKSAPKTEGIHSEPPYYEKKESAFSLICGKRFLVREKYPLIPILHVKNWPLKDNLKRAYERCYIDCINTLK